MEQEFSELKEIDNFEACSKNNESKNKAQTSESISSVKKSDQTQDAKPKRVRKPEMVRYQPPSSRTSKPSEKKPEQPKPEPVVKKSYKSSRSSEVVISQKEIIPETKKSTKQETRFENKPKQKSEPPFRHNMPEVSKSAQKPRQEPKPEVCRSYKLSRSAGLAKTNNEKEFSTTPVTINKNNSFQKREKSLEKSQVLEKSPVHTGGLLKLNSSALNQLKASKELEKDQSEHEDDKEVKDYVKNFRNLKFSRGTGKSVQKDDQEYKMLFNPNNPDKPIYVQDSHHPNQAQGSRRELSEARSRYESTNEADQSRQTISHSSSGQLSPEIIKVNNLFKQMQLLEQNLNSHYDSHDETKSFENFTQKVNSMRKKFEVLCIEATFCHLETANGLNIDFNFWRCCFHRLIETLRKEYNSLKSSDRNQELFKMIGNVLKEYIDDGMRFYADFVEKLENKYLKFNTQDLVDLNLTNNVESIQKSFLINMTMRSKNMKLALMFINRCWISQGDLARYEELIFATSSVNLSPSQNITQRDYSIARTFYLKAKCIAPKSSRAYHQLAIIAVYTKRRLDACYYYFRCLQVNQPLTSVRQALNSIFDEARIRSDAILKFIQAAIVNKQKRKTMADNKNEIKKEGNEYRVETWFKPSFAKKTEQEAEQGSESPEFKLDSSVTSSEGDDENSSNTSSDSLEDVENSQMNEKKLSTSELNKRFMHNYLNTIGKLFTKVGMETYQEVCSQMLHEFSELLKRQSCSFGKMRMLQITVINLSVIDLIHSSSKPHPNSSMYHRSQLLESAVQLSLDMFAITIKRFNSILSKNELTEEDADSWRLLFPSIKVFIDWMLCNSQIWQPFPDQLSPDLGPNPKRWQIISTMLNLAGKIKVDIKFSEEICSKIKLDEELELVGFVPLLSMPQDNFKSTSDDTNSFHDLTEDMVETIKDQKRIEKLSMFAEYLCGMEYPYIKYDVANECYKPLASVYSAEHNKLGFKRNESRTVSTSSSCGGGGGISLNDFEPEQNLELEDMDEDLIRLKEKKRQLQMKMTEQAQREKKHEILLESSTQRRLELEIRPKFIVPDTNCFVDHLNLIDKLLMTNYYIIIVPLLVINELDKLAKSISNYNDDSIEHAEYVQRNARKSIQYLTTKFEKRERNLKALTSQGSVMETITFRSEEVKAQGTTDELILGCCLHYCRDAAKNFMPNSQTDAIHLYREVVLLTDDRHLRLKAHTRNVPVKDIVKFARWSDIIADEPHHHHRHHHHQNHQHRHNHQKNLRRSR